MNTEYERLQRQSQSPLFRSPVQYDSTVHPAQRVGMQRLFTPLDVWCQNHFSLQFFRQIHFFSPKRIAKFVFCSEFHCRIIFFRNMKQPPSRQGVTTESLPPSMLVHETCLYRQDKTDSMMSQSGSRRTCCLATSRKVRESVSKRGRSRDTREEAIYGQVLRMPAPFRRIIVYTMLLSIVKINITDTIQLTFENQSCQLRFDYCLSSCTKRCPHSYYSFA